MGVTVWKKQNRLDLTKQYISSITFMRDKLAWELTLLTIFVTSRKWSRGVVLQRAK